jgi:Fe2+/Zn2+ uptake regulation proteins
MNQHEHHRQYSDHEVEQLLIKHGVKPTPQRAVIAKYLLSTDSHPTAEEVFQAVTGNLPVPLSRATVYNTLNALVEARVILEVVIEPGKSRYDAKVVTTTTLSMLKAVRSWTLSPMR